MHQLHEKAKNFYLMENTKKAAEITIRLVTLGVLTEGSVLKATKSGSVCTPRI